MGRYKSAEEVLNNFRSLILHLHQIVNGGEINNDALERDIELAIGPGQISATMLGRYLNTTGKGEYLKREVRPTTYLSLARYLRIKEGVKWGRSDQDALTAVYDWVAYGPGGAPAGAPADRHKNRPTAEQILAATSKTIEGLKRELPGLTNSELLQIAETCLSTVIDRGDDAPAPVPEPVPVPICEDSKPLPLLILIELGRTRPTTESERGEVVNLLASKTRIDPPRCREIICGDTPTADEIKLLAPIVKRSVQSLTEFVAATASLASNHENVPRR
jgi:hypothetical protein